MFRVVLSTLIFLFPDFEMKKLLSYRLYSTDCFNWLQSLEQSRFSLFRLIKIITLLRLGSHFI